jgi:hypothetical protein
LVTFIDIWLELVSGMNILLLNYRTQIRSFVNEMWCPTLPKNFHDFRLNRARRGDGEEWVARVKFSYRLPVSGG